jgi:hypothetical protein
MSASQALIDAYTQAERSQIAANYAVTKAEQMLRAAKDAQLEVIHTVDALRAILQEQS